MIRTTQNEQAIKIGNWIAVRLDKYEIACLSVLLVGLILKTSTEMSINFIIVLSLMAMSTLYFFSGFANINYDYASGLDIFFHKLASWACSVGIIGILFRLQNWPGYDFFTRVGCIILIILIPFIFYRKSKNDDLKLFNKRYILRLILICTVGLLLVFTPEEILIKSTLIS